MSTPMIRTPQVAAMLQCNLCGVSLSERLPYAEAMAAKAAMEPWECSPSCGCVAIHVALSIRLTLDPIATVRAKHPHAFALPPCSANGRPNWSLYPHAEWPPDPIAEGPTEAAAWLAAAEGVGA